MEDYVDTLHNEHAVVRVPYIAAYYFDLISTIYIL